MYSEQAQLLIQHGPALLVKVAIAVFAGGLLGYERQRLGKPVGMLTAAMVTLGSLIFVQGGMLMASKTMSGADPTRLASMIVSGIGFIGAGAIMRSRFHIGGLASAATIWCLGGLGVLIAWDQALVALGFALVLFTLLRVVPYLEHLLFSDRFCVHCTLVVEPERVDAVEDFLRENLVTFKRLPQGTGDGGVRLVIDQCGLEAVREIVPQISGVQGVRQVIRRRS